MIVSNFEVIGCRSMSMILLFVDFVMIGTTSFRCSLSLDV